jgi:hypothetical protein
MDKEKREEEKENLSKRKRKETKNARKNEKKDSTNMRCLQIHPTAHPLDNVNEWLPGYYISFSRSTYSRVPVTNYNTNHFLLKVIAVTWFYARVRRIFVKP